MGSTNNRTGQVIAVTGAARGIGLAIAGHLAESGARVAIGDLDAATAEAAAAGLSGTAAGFELDVTDRASFTRFLDAVEEQWGPIDVLVNNAGVMWVGRFDEESDQATHRQLEVNLHGVIRGVRLAAPRMRSRGRGHIVTVASAASKLAPPGEATYAATKHGVYGYLSAVRAELRGSGVELSIVMPTVVDTELAAGTSSGSVAMLTPQDVAAAVAGVIDRPRFEVTVPRYVGPLARAVSVLPDALRQFVYRQMVPNQVDELDGNRSAREKYETSALTATENSGDDK
ncbi:MAG: SDR family oxidoreductase [Rhodococcus sp. (in: high G+C Gram-positive bacteria)]|uniref:SDR family oxidoreductase n=1 Tax=Rhodococcus sp. TaxID=1831 RepID=UPI003BB6F37D